MRETDSFIRRVIVLGFVAKLIGATLRFTIMADLYGGRGDFNRYLERGSLIGDQLRSGTWPEEASQTGTPFMDFISGVVFAVAPRTLAAGFIIFSLLSFIGAYFFFLAFKLAVPEGNHRRYALLVFLVPTMVFWPSSLGKEAWLVFTLGLAAYGAARALRRIRWGYTVLALGTAGVFAVRPHMAALFAISFVAAYLIRFRDPDVRRGTVAWVLGLVIVGLGAGFVAVNFGDELPQDESIEGPQTEQILAETIRRTTSGGSSFDSRPVRSPADLGHALLTVPFRPFPWEGHNFQAMAAGLEGTILLLIILASFTRLLALPVHALRRPYLAMATAYSLGFVVAFSNVGNFGILTRQRAQLIPLLLVLICLPPLGERLRNRRRPPVLVELPDDPRDVATVTSDDESPSGPLALVTDGRQRQDSSPP